MNSGRSSPPPKANQDVESAEDLETAQNSSMLIGNVSKIMRQRAGKIPLVAVDLCEILKSLQRHYSRTGVRTITINLKAIPVCYVLANELITDVFANLIINSIKHSPGICHLIIDIEIIEIGGNEHKYYLISISDNGPGISDELKAKLFTRIQKGQTKEKGRGLGLYLVKTLVEAFNGTVRVEDRVPGDYGRGVRFVVKLPSAML
jgi:signal transduction histidine kinase